MMSADLEPPLGGDSARTQTHRSPQVEGSTLGPYRLLERLGEGGMGEVWLAEQKLPLRRQVAIKLIKPGLDTAQVMARFQAERQALALMDHPGIAKVFDAGATEQGRPYFAMEYVRGEAITAYCDRNRLTTAERLDLFIRACEAVQHAHQKGIIHRDLKPSNILIAQQDDRPVPKIIDFGVAKAMSQPLVEHTLYTALTGFVGTPEYMSPEQAEMGGSDIDTRTDVYALGVVLYELLTGTLPFDRHVLHEKSIDEVRRIIRELEPPRPSTRSTHTSAGTEAAGRRGTDPGRLASLLRGDLDWITMKALEKDRARRYASVSELAADIRRHLTNQPVMAGPPSALYRTSKFVRRHRFGVAAAAVVATLLIGFAAVTILQAQRVARERDRANREAEAAKQVSDFLVGLFEVSRPNEATANSVTAREILDRGVERIRDAPGIDIATRSRLLATMGDVYESVGLPTQALPLHEEALALRTQAFGDSSAEATESKLQLGRVLRSQGRPAEAERVAREVVALEHRTDDVISARALNLLGWALADQAQYDEAESSFVTAAAQLERDSQEHLHEVASALRGLGAVQFYRGDAAEAERLFRESHMLHARVFGPNHPKTLADLDNVASALLLQGQYAEAEVIYRTNLTELIRTHGPEHPTIGDTHLNLGATLFMQEKYDAAEASYREALAFARHAHGNLHPDVARALSNLAESLHVQGRYRESASVAEEGLDVARRVLGEQHPLTASNLVNLAQALVGLGHSRRAETAARTALQIRIDTLGPDHTRTKEAESVLAAAIAAQSSDHAKSVRWI